MPNFHTGQACCLGQKLLGTFTGADHLNRYFREVLIIIQVMKSLRKYEQPFRCYQSPDEEYVELGLVGVWRAR